ncbi:GNAT family N-acetyltransferase [Zooshikella ganghwensis]|uniref:GNAT family N-acetyltransferase n=1 Tax=Zooshikella ganghwensis TaxID=202772 RepID=UPI00041DFD11|nr:GNAT family N-acetyltransferase [Zooshikella ganghwensis]
MCIRQIIESDWDSIEQIQAQSYYEVEAEDISVLKSKWVVSPCTCKVFAYDGCVLGYLLAHPWANKAPPKLHEKITVSEKACSRLYLHDLAVDQHSRGNGVAHRLVEDLLETALAANVQEIMLVSVQLTTPFWSRYGFKKDNNVAICQSYGPSGCLMRKEM